MAEKALAPKFIVMPEKVVRQKVCAGLKRVW